MGQQPCKVAVVVSHPAWRRAVPRLVGFTREVLRATPLRLEVGVAYIDDAAQQTLNSRYRGFDKPTNVLAFPGEARHGQAGDIAVAFETVKTEAKAAQKSISAHTAHLLVHGALHLLGYDHEADTDAAQMMRKEVEILKSLGYNNPYAEDIF